MEFVYYFTEYMSTDHFTPSNFQVDIVTCGILDILIF